MYFDHNWGRGGGSSSSSINDPDQCFIEQVRRFGYRKGQLFTNCHYHTTFLQPTYLKLIYTYSSRTNLISRWFGFIISPSHTAYPPLFYTKSIPINLLYPFTIPVRSIKIIFNEPTHPSPYMLGLLKHSPLNELFRFDQLSVFP